MTSSGTTALFVQVLPAPEPVPYTMTVSHPGVEVTWVHDDDPLTPEEEAELARIFDERRNGPFLPLWMILRLPSWVCGVCFWVKRRLGLR